MYIDAWWKFPSEWPAGTKPVGAIPPEGTEIWCADAAGVQHGPATFFREEDGTVRRSGPYVEGLQEGEWTWFWPGGKPRMQGAFVAGRQEGVWRQWYPNGNLESEGSCRAGLKCGVWLFNTEARKKAAEVNFVAGRRNGATTEWHPNGVLAVKSWYDEDALDGQYIGYHPTGAKAESGLYRRGQRYGVWLSWDGLGDPTGEREY